MLEFPGAPHSAALTAPEGTVALMWLVFYVVFSAFLVAAWMWVYREA